ncbi:unnamed protein product [marine sediment metagenome]|uniref:Uncharacterized protein n=1 Tax=marine sediment metagenome TaxID=412755 RepID=X0SIX6_9ZZZZ
MIIDFNNQFTEEKDILVDIPDEEYENLGRACVDILKRIIRERTFAGEGTIEERKRRYEEKSNPVMLILNNKYEKDVNGSVLFQDFYEEIKTHLAENNLRMMSGIEVGKILRSDGLEVKLKTIDGKNGRFILGIRELLKLPKLPNSQSTPTRKEISGPLRNLSNSGNTKYIKSWRKSGGETRTKETVVSSIGNEGVAYLLRMGQIFETSPGNFKPV